MKRKPYKKLDSGLKSSAREVGKQTLLPSFNQKT